MIRCCKRSFTKGDLLFTLFFVCILLKESVKKQVSNDDDCVHDVEDELVDWHDLEEEDGVVLLRSQTGVVDQELGPVSASLFVCCHDIADAIEEDDCLTPDDDIVRLLVGVG